MSVASCSRRRLDDLDLPRGRRPTPRHFRRNLGSYCRVVSRTKPSAAWRKACMTIPAPTRDWVFSLPIRRMCPRCWGQRREAGSRCRARARPIHWGSLAKSARNRRIQLTAPRAASRLAPKLSSLRRQDRRGFPERARRQGLPCPGEPYPYLPKSQDQTAS